MNWFNFMHRICTCMTFHLQNLHDYKRFSQYLQVCTLCLWTFVWRHAFVIRQARSMARCLLELSLQDYELSQIRPSMLALCMWKSALEHVNTDDGNFLPPGLFFTREDFQHVFREVKMFSENLQQSFPEIVNICDHYSNMYSQEWRHPGVSWWKKITYLFVSTLWKPQELDRYYIVLSVIGLRSLFSSSKCVMFKMMGWHSPT